ncbi:MAG TPA: permease [Candidatus Paceibacterota bacterium]|nr:permease [Candidatus Paceibacterota bacterium]
MNVVIDFGTILTGILFVATPFLIVGIGISSIIQLYVPQERLLALYGRSFWRNYGISLGAGFLFPVCECGIVPIARGLAKKGVPTSAMVMFLLSAPVTNPITLGATVVAFPASPVVWIGRLLVAQAVVLAIGWIFQAYQSGKSAASVLTEERDGMDVCDVPPLSARDVLRVLDTTYHEFRHVFPYVLIGGSITSLLQLAIPKEYFLSLSGHPLLAIGSFMALALVLSVCSSVDAFVILPFAAQIPFGALLAFLNFGPLIDVKNILLFRAYFTRRFQYAYFGIVTAVTFLVVWLLGYYLSAFFPL